MSKPLWFLALGVCPTLCSSPIALADSPTELDPISVTGRPPPVPELRLNPAYPMSARHRWEEGCVVLRFTVRPDGTTDEFAIMESNPRGVFERNVIVAVYRWRYAPAPETRIVVEQFEFRNPRLGASPVKSVVSTHMPLDRGTNPNARLMEMHMEGYKRPRCDLWDKKNVKSKLGDKSATKRSVSSYPKKVLRTGKTASR